MRKPKKTVEAGFPGFWQQVYEQNTLFFDTTKELESLQNAILRKPISGDLQKAVGYLASSVSNSFGALITLVLNGYGNDAVVIARRMFESELTAAYLKRHPEKVEDYLDFYYVHQKRLYDETSKSTPELVHGIPRERVAELEQKFKEVAPRFRKNNQLRTRWTEASVRQMAEGAGLVDLYHGFYSVSSSMLHADIIGLTSQTDQLGYLDFAPSKLWLKEALVSGHGSVLRVLYCYNSVAQLGMETDIEAALCRFREVWQQRIAQ